MPTPLNTITFTTSAAEPASIIATERPRVRYSRDTIVFLHGLGCDRSAWDLLLDIAEETESALNAYRLISIDLPGHGATPPIPTIAPMDAWRNTIIDVLELLLATDVVHLVAHSASVPVAIQAMAHVDEYYHADREGTLGSLLSIEGNHTLADCGTVSRRIAEQFESWYRAGGHVQLGQEMHDSGRIESIAWSRMWRHADPWTVWGIARQLCHDVDYVELAQYWNAYPYRAYLCGQESTIPRSTQQLMGAPYPDPPTLRYTIPSAWHFPMVTSPVETLHMIATALQDMESHR